MGATLVILIILAVVGLLVLIGWVVSRWLGAAGTAGREAVDADQADEQVDDDDEARRRNVRGWLDTHGKARKPADPRTQREGWRKPPS